MHKQKRKHEVVIQIFCIALAALFYSACVNVHPSPTTTIAKSPAQRTLAINTQATTLVEPDHALVTVEFSIKSATEAQARASVHEAITTLTQTLKDQGVQAGDIAFQSVSINPQWKHDPTTRERQPDGFLAAKNTVVTLRNLNKLGQTMREIIRVSAKVGTVSDVTLAASDLSAFKEDAREKASAKLMAKAHQLAKGTNTTLGPVMSLSETSQGQRSVMSKEVIQAQGTSREELKLELTLSLQATFSLGIK